MRIGQRIFNLSKALVPIQDKPFEVVALKLDIDQLAKVVKVAQRRGNLELRADEVKNLTTLQGLALLIQFFILLINGDTKIPLTDSKQSSSKLEVEVLITF